MRLQVKDDAECQRNKQRPASFLLGSCTRTHKNNTHLPSGHAREAAEADLTPPVRHELGLCAVHPAHPHARMLNY